MRRGELEARRKSIGIARWQALIHSVSFSADNRQIVSASRDRTIKLWNTLGECKFNIVEDGHSEWVSCVRFSPNPVIPVIVSAGWDKVVKVSTVFHSPFSAILLCSPYPSIDNIEMMRSNIFATSEAWPMRQPIHQDL